MMSNDKMRPLALRGGNCCRLQVSVWVAHALLVFVLVMSISNNMKPHHVHYEGGSIAPRNGVERRVPSPSADGMCGGLPSFEEFFRSNQQGYGLHKWIHYFDTYETHLRQYCYVKDLRMIEVGLQSGGSVAMWKGVMGNSLQLYLGIDINPKQVRHESQGSHVKVEIGDQGSPTFWRGVKEKYQQPFDIIIDDGSHLEEHMWVTFLEMWSQLRPGGTYVIEDIISPNKIVERIMNGHGESPSHNQELHANVNEHCDRICHVDTNAVQKWVESITVHPHILYIKKRKEELHVFTIQKIGKRIGLFGIGFD